MRVIRPTKGDRVLKPLQVLRGGWLDQVDLSGGHLIIPRGAITLPDTFGTPENFRTEYISFTVARLNLPYNAFLWCPLLYKFMARTTMGTCA